MTHTENPGASGASGASVSDLLGGNRTEDTGTLRSQQPTGSFSGLRSVRSAAMAGSYNPMAYLHVPYDVDAEQALLGAILADNRALERVGPLLKAEYFHDPFHVRIFETMSRMIQSGATVTPITLQAVLKSDPGYLAISGPSGVNYFELLEMNAPIIAPIRDFVAILADLAVRRSLVRMAEDLAQAAFDPPSEAPSAKLISDANHNIGLIAEQARRFASPISPCLSLADWLSRSIPASDNLLGEVFKTTSRIMLVAATGLGKTNFALAMAFAMAAGKQFLHWRAGRPARVLFIDGEMSRRLMKKRLADAARRHGGAPDTLFTLCREDVDDMPPLNTPEGQAYIDAIIQQLGGVDFILFDNVQSLLAGDMKEELPWQETLSWIKQLTKREIGQCWIHHTGWEKSRSYGTSTREWQMDTVAVMEAVERPNSDIAFTLKFTKARERDPDNRADFETVVVTLGNDHWSVDCSKPHSATQSLTTIERGWLADITDLFASGAVQSTVPTPGMAAVDALTRAEVREGLKRRGRFSADHNEPLTQAHRTKLSTMLNALKNKRKLCMTDKYVWLMQEGQ